MVSCVTNHPLYVITMKISRNTLNPSFPRERESILVPCRRPSDGERDHREMKNVAWDVLQVMAFYGSREKLQTVGEGIGS